jgi:hypothetical protein
MSGRRRILFVSELAALIGQNRYKSVGEASVSLFQRLHPQLFQAATKRLNAVVKSDEQIVDDLDLSSDIEIAVATDDENAATKKTREIMKRPLVKATDESVARVQTLLLNADVLPSAKLDTLVDTIASRNELRPQTKTKLVNGAASLLTKAAKTSKTVARADIEAFLNLVKIEDSAVAAKSVRGVVNKSRGTKNEAEGIAKYEAKTGVDVREKNSKFYMKNIGDVDDPCWIGGRVDGIVGDKIIEVKCRRNRFFTWLVPYEKIQTQAYMEICDKSECDLVQKFNGEIKTDTYMRDPEFWSAIREDIRDFWDEFRTMLGSEELQDELLTEYC